MTGLTQVAVLFAATLSPAVGLAASVDYRKAITAIASDIAELKSAYPQLREFSVDKHLRAGELQISYEFHTGRPQRGGGWTSGAPSPRRDGTWFYIDFHEADSTQQIHTQPVTAPICVGTKRVSFLSLEGAQTKSLYGAIHKILARHGVAGCSRRS